MENWGEKHRSGVGKPKKPLRLSETKIPKSFAKKTDDPRVEPTTAGLRRNATEIRPAAAVPSRKASPACDRVPG